MPNHILSTLGAVALVSLMAPGVQATPADDLESIRFGDTAVTFASGSIQRMTSQDGFVNVITGDNQTTGDRMQLGQYDTMYLKLKQPADAAVGDYYTIFKRTRKVFHPATGEYLGYLVNRLAIVQVVQVDKHLTTVQAVRSYGAVSPGDPVVRFSLPVEAGGAAAPASEDASGMIIELQADMGLTLVAQRNIVYLDRGSEHGLQPGHRLEIRRSGGSLPPRVVGELKVLSTEARTSTALITKSTARVFKGDRFRLKSAEPEVMPVSQPASQSLDGPTGVPTDSPKPNRFQSVESASRETRITLDGDVAKQIRFESGEAAIKQEWYQVLDQLVEHLKGIPADQLIRVEGHADNMEIGPSLKSVYPTNWDLSKARAGGVLRYLVEKGGIDSARITSLGFGDSKPVASNTSEGGRQKNRRVDIILYSPESAKVPVEQAAKPAPGDQGYQVSGLEGGKAATAGPAAESAAAVPGQPAVENPVPVVADPVPAATPSMDAPVLPNQDGAMPAVPPAQ